jgi:hypothetical protein
LTTQPYSKPRTPADGPAVVLGPGNAAAFDGDQWHLPVVVRVVDTPLVWVRDEPTDAATVVADVVESHDVETVQVRGLDRLGEYFSEFSVERLTSTLEQIAGRADVPLLVGDDDTSIDRSEPV